MLRSRARTTQFLLIGSTCSRHPRETRPSGGQYTQPKTVSWHISLHPRHTKYSSYIHHPPFPHPLIPLVRGSGSDEKKCVSNSLVAGLTTLLLDDVGELFELALGAEEGAELLYCQLASFLRVNDDQIPRLLLEAPDPSKVLHCW